MSNGNGTNKLLYWLLSLFAASVLSLAGTWAAHVNKQLDAIIDVNTDLKTRASVQEERVRNVENKVDTRLNRIEDKVDKLIQRTQ